MENDGLIFELLISFSNNIGEICVGNHSLPWPKNLSQNKKSS
jgi:hypothetical protein